MGRKKKEIKLKEPVRIREKRLNDGNISLYLDMYHKGARKKEGKASDRPQLLQAARCQGEAAEEQFDKGVSDHRGGEAADGHAVPV